jgi:hypothetical protein
METDPLYFVPKAVTKHPICFGSSDPSFQKGASHIAKLGSTADTPLPVTTGLTLCEGSWLWATSPVPIKLITHHRFVDNYESALEVTCSQAVRLHVQANASIIPTGALGEGFATGWTKLPVQLKLRILAANLTFPDPISSGPWASQHVLYHHLSLTPEIATLAKEVYYGSNVFRIRRYSTPLGNGRVFASNAIDLPPAQDRHLIRRLAYQFVLLPPSYDLTLMRELSLQEKGFTNLQHVVLVGLRHPAPRERRRLALQYRKATTIPASIQFECKGRIEYMNEPGLYPDDAGPDITPGYEAFMESYATFKGGESTLEEIPRIPYN